LKKYAKFGTIFLIGENDSRQEREERGEPHVFVSADTRQKALSVKPDKVLNI